MACFIYIWPGRKGLHVYLWPTADPDESVVIYLAANSWLATLIIAAWYCAYGTAPLEPPHALQQAALRLALGRKKPQASCGLRDSLLDGRAGEPRDDRRFRRRRTRLRIGTPHAIWLAPVA